MTSPEPTEQPAPTEPATPAEPDGSAEPAAADAPSPPLPWLAGYRVLGLRLPDEYRPWVARDVASKSFLTWRIGRTILWFLVLIGLVYVGIGLMHEPPGRPRLIQMLLVSLAVSLLSSGTTLVRRTLRWQRIDRRGRPVRPKGLAVLGNTEALVAGGAVLVLFTAAMGVFGYTLRPTLPCDRPDAATLDQIRGGFKSAETKIERAHGIRFGEAQVVAAYVKRAGQPQVGLSVWMVEGETVYEFRTEQGAEQSPTTFPPPPTADRLAPEAVIRAVECLTGRRIA